MQNKSLIEQWRDEGYVVIRNLTSPDEAVSMRRICEVPLAQWRERNPQYGSTTAIDKNCMRHINHWAYFRSDQAALREILELIADDRVINLVRMLLGEEPLFRHTSYFINPLRNGHDGNWHRDSQYIYDDPEVEKRKFLTEFKGTTIQVQIPLVPSDDVEYVPRSHLRWDTEQEFAIRLADGRTNSASNHMPGAVRLSLQPGDALVFNPAGLHRGRYHADKLRRTLLLTYSSVNRPLFDGFIEQSWFLQPGYLDGLRPKTRAFFETFIATFQAHWQMSARTKDAKS